MSNSKETKHAQICENLHKTYVAKNHDYGDAFEKLWGEVGHLAGYTKIADKFYRLQNLWNGNKEAQVNESIYDTLIDLANYCILSAIELDTAPKNKETANPARYRWEDNSI